MVCPAAFLYLGMGLWYKYSRICLCRFLLLRWDSIFKAQDTLPGKSVAGPLVIGAFREFPGTFAIEFYSV